jgi:hypothetical protein
VVVELQHQMNSKVLNQLLLLTDFRRNRLYNKKFYFTLIVFLDKEWEFEGFISACFCGYFMFIHVIGTFF